MQSKHQLSSKLYNEIRKKQLDIHHIQQLLELGADPNKIMGLSYTALHAACFKHSSNFELIKLLFTYGANPLLEVKGDKNCLNLLFYHDDLNIEVIKLLLEKGVNPNTFAKYRGDNSLTAACHKFPNNLDLIKLLLTHGANPNLINQYGENCLDQFDRRTITNMKLIQLLLDHDADPTNLLMGSVVNKNYKLGLFLVTYAKIKYIKQFHLHESILSDSLSKIINLIANHSNPIEVTTFLQKRFQDKHIQTCYRDLSLVERNRFKTVLTFFNDMKKNQKTKRIAPSKDMRFIIFNFLLQDPERIMDETLQAFNHNEKKQVKFNN
ncbi:MAG: ankyrin repeat domain-containing protein [Legionella longbeachae]|nr:ankyrin repeat domain-containing protein [Legionella longbeachae]